MTANRPVEALIDTGASRTVINPALATSLGLQQVDTIKVAHVGGVAEAPVYAAAIEFPNTELESVPALEVIASTLPSQPVSCLIGRDILQRWILTYDGRTGVITIESH
jgi:predicted aspartyl protease